MNQIRPEFEFSIRQEPMKGKICGMEEMPNRSYLYPGLVIQLNSEHSKPYLDSLNLVCHVSLVDGFTQAQVGVLRSTEARMACNPADSYLTTMAGKTTVSPTILIDPEDGHPRIFFVFRDLCIKMRGHYQLVCHVVNMDRYTTSNKSMWQYRFDDYRDV